MNLKGCLEEIDAKKEERLLTGNNRNLTYKFSFKEFWHSLTSQSEQELAKRKAESMVIQQIAKAAEQVCENELNRCKWQSEVEV